MMKIQKNWGFVLLAFSSGAFSQTIYLTCKTTAYPELNLKAIYKNLPPNARDQFLTDAVTEGLGGIIVNKPESWSINLAESRISSPEGNGADFTNLKTTEARIIANRTSPVGNIFTYDLNRINGKLTYQIDLADETRREWKKKHGGSLPTLWTWKQECIAATNPKI